MSRDRPGWCPHQDCEVVCSMAGGHPDQVICGGRLPEPEAHGPDKNTHRLCVAEVDSLSVMLDLQINRSDLMYFRRVIDALSVNMQLDHHRR